MTPRFAPVTFSEMDGVRYLHFGTEWVQGAMRLRKPDAIELEYAQQMMAWLLFLSPSAPEFHVTQLGLGAAALTKFCHRQFSRARVTAVELNPAVIIAGRSMFGLREDDERLTVREQDAWDYDGWIQLGLVRQDRRDLRGAQAALRSALACQPDAAPAAVNLGIVLQEDGQPDAALAAYAHAYRVAPETFGRIAQALCSGPHGRLWADLGALRALLASLGVPGNPGNPGNPGSIQD